MCVAGILLGDVGEEFRDGNWTDTIRIWYDQFRINSDACATELSVRLRRGSQLSLESDCGEEDGEELTHNRITNN